MKTDACRYFIVVSYLVTINRPKAADLNGTKMLSKEGVLINYFKMSKQDN